MPTIPDTSKAKLTAATPQVLNTVYDNASEQFRATMPRVKEGDIGTLRFFGAQLALYPDLQNEFIGALVNRIARVIISSKFYTNPWARFKRGYLENGEFIEEIFVNMAKPYKYDRNGGEHALFRNYDPEVLSAFHRMNYQIFYPVTIYENDLKFAFNSWEGVTDLINRIIEQLYTAANYDEFIVMKYMLARAILDGNIYAMSGPVLDASNADAVVTNIKELSNNLVYMSNIYNVAGVRTHTEKDRQHLILSSKASAILDVNSLAKAYNLQYVDFVGLYTPIDSFGALDNERLQLLLGNDPSYREITAAEMQSLDDIGIAIVDEDWFMIFDNLERYKQQENGATLQWNYFLHVWKTFSYSPFANAAVFINGEPSVTAVSVMPSTATASAGQSVQFTANVTTTNFASKGVIWTSDNPAVQVTPAGLAVIPPGTSAGSATITATSKYDASISGTATLTIS